MFSRSSSFAIFKFDDKLLLITTIQLIDEYFDLKQKVTNQKNKLEEISNKFKEIKSLAIQYKDDKDVEIKKLKVTRIIQRRTRGQ